MSLLLALICLGAVAGGAALLLLGVRRLPLLTAVRPPPGPLPTVSVVIAARDEAAHIAATVRALLAAATPGLEVVVVDDRSGDGTWGALEGLAVDPRLRRIRLDRLPPGWLGKNHALARGAAAARGEWLLFMDADVRLEPGALPRALAEAGRQRLDHLAVFPSLEARGLVLRLMLLQFAMSFLAWFRPWRLPEDRRAYVGVGAFNLVRAAAYRRAGGHAAFALSPLDDMMLGRVVARAGGRSAAALSGGLVRLAWYPSAGEMIRHFEKNAFAAFGFRLTRLVALTAVIALLGLWPWLGLALATGLERALHAATVAVTVLVHGVLARGSGWPVWIGLASPLGTLAMLWLWWRGSLLACWRGAVRWRGTTYPLAALRAHHDRLMRD
ncbi:glycosyltransferase [Spiribacter halobius]|nr:glycosyltransferase family A protein [Spiribacter halobius]UEX78517.1 glycosyltransferase family 2 protein [Spiribacter halobius]